MKKRTQKFFLFVSSILIISCSNFSKSKKTTKNVDQEEIIITKPLDIGFFETANLAEPISKQQVKISDGTTKEFYKIVIKPEPTEHQTGPWCPITINDSKEKGGIWLKDGHIYDVDGSFIAHLDEFYNDPNWKLYKENGAIKITNTQEACEAAAKPNVEEQYHNYCVECLPSYYKNVTNTFLIPVEPIYNENTTRVARGGVGLAFNGVKFDGPAPIHAIIAAHTLAPLDDCGGHVNPHAGYHYHAATGCTKKIDQTNGHSAQIGYAMDGFGIYELSAKNTDLDECNGHTDDLIGYHYHANEAGKNQILPCFHGITASVERERGVGHRPPPPHHDKKE